jgi:hypothetical protein
MMKSCEAFLGHQVAMVMMVAKAVPKTRED